MKKNVIVFLMLFVTLFTIASESIEDIIAKQWGIDYSNPEKYLEQGPQTQIPKAYAEEIDAVVVEVEKIADLKPVYEYIFNNFESVPAGGRYIGVMTVERMLESRETTGCHASALLLVSFLRHNNVPAIMVDGVNLNFVEEYPDHRGFGGHVYVEAYIDGKWVLLNSTQDEIVVDYDYTDPVLKGLNDSPYEEPLGNYVMFKGLDSQTYGIDSHEKLIEKLILYAEYLNSEYDVEKYFENYDTDPVKDLNDFNSANYTNFFEDTWNIVKNIFS